MLQLPPDLPGYWTEIAKFACHQSDITITQDQARTFVDNLHFLNGRTFISDNDLWRQLLGKNGSTALVGLTLISPSKMCSLCGSKLTVMKDRPSVLVVYTHSFGTIAAKHYRKVCSKARTGCAFVQHYGFHSKGQYTS